MTVRTVAVERFSLTSAAPFESVMARIDAAVGHPDPRAFVAAMGAAPTVAALEDVVAGAVGSSGIMEFARFDIGEVLRKDRPGMSARALRLLLGRDVPRPILVVPGPHGAHPRLGPHAPASVGLHAAPDAGSAPDPAGIRRGRVLLRRPA